MRYPFAELLKKIRKDAGVSQEYLAGMLNPESGGVASTISRWETGERLPRTSAEVSELANVLNADTEALLLSWVAQQLYKHQTSDAPLADILAQTFEVISDKLELLFTFAPDLLESLVDTEGQTLLEHLVELRESLGVPTRFFRTTSYVQREANTWRILDRSVDLLATFQNLQELNMEMLIAVEHDLPVEVVQALSKAIDDLMEHDELVLTRALSRKLGLDVKKALITLLAQELGVDARKLKQLITAGLNLGV